MCAHAISLFRIRRLIFGAYDPKSGGVDHGARIFDAPSCHHRPEILGGLRETESAALLRDFFRRAVSRMASTTHTAPDLARLPITHEPAGNQPGGGVPRRALRLVIIALGQIIDLPPLRRRRLPPC